MDAYSYVSSGGGMILLLLILGAIITYLLFSKGLWLDKYCKEEREKWNGSDIEPHYQEGTPFTPSLDKPFDDPEVPNRPSKRKKPRKGKTKRVYKRKRKGK